MKRYILATVTLVLLMGAVFVVLGGALSPAASAGSTFTVNSTADAVDASPGDGMCATAGGVCTLRAAIQETNALAGADTIDLPAGTYVLEIAGAGEDYAASGDLDIRDDLTITGEGAVGTVVDGGGIDRVFQVGGLDILPPTIDMSDVTIRNGSAWFGSGVYSYGTLALTDVIVSANAGSDWGAVFNEGTLTLANTAVIGNESSEINAGIYNEGVATLTDTTVSGNDSDYGIDNGGSLTATDSTISGNTGGGIANAGTLLLDGSTISGNSGGGLLNTLLEGEVGSATVTNSTISSNAGGGIQNGAPLELNNVTVAYNRIDIGEEVAAGIHNYFGEVLISNSIVAGNRASSTDSDCFGTLSSLGYNLVGDATGCTIDGDTTGNIIGVDPGLDPLLGDNGGPTQTHAFLDGSPAIDAGNPAAPGSGGDACEATDQRGVERPTDGDGDGAARCDMGAFEAPPAPTANYHITVDTTADGAPGNVQVSRQVSGPFTIEIEVGDDFSMPDSWFQGLHAFEFGLQYPQSLIAPSEAQWDVNESYLAGWSCSTNSTGGGLAILVCAGWEPEPTATPAATPTATPTPTPTPAAAHPTGPGVVASLTFNTSAEACGQGELILVDDWCDDGCPPQLWGNDLLFVPLTLNNGTFAVRCETEPPTATPTPSPTPTPTPTATATPSPTPTRTPTATAAAAPTATPAPTGTPIAPLTATPLPTVTPSPTPTPYGGAAPGARGPLPPATGGGGLAAGDGSALGWPTLAALVLALAAACAAAAVTMKTRAQ